MIDRLLSAAVSAAYHEWMMLHAPAYVWIAGQQVRRETLHEDFQDGVRHARAWEREVAR